MSPHQAYRQSAAAGWSRIDLLVVLYDVGIDTAQRARRALAARNEPDGYQPELVRLRLRMQRVLVLLLDGLNPEQGEIARRLQQLGVFLLDRSLRGAADDWDAVLRILTILRDGYAAIRDEAAALEARGEIPPLDAPAAWSAIA